MIVKEEVTGPQNWLMKYIWKRNIPMKIKILCWLVLNNKILSWDNLQSRGFNSLGICLFCWKDSETVSHLFSHCSFFNSVWREVCRVLSIQFSWNLNNLEENINLFHPCVKIHTKENI